MQEGLIYLRQDVDEVTHIFGEIQIFSVAEIKASLILNPLDGINRTVRIQLRGHLHIVDGADHNCIAGNGSTLANLNAGGI